MKLVNVCPDIPDSWRGGVTDVCRLLGLCKETIRKAANRGRRHGGIDWTAGKNGRKCFSGKEVNRFWRSYG